MYIITVFIKFMNNKYIPTYVHGKNIKYDVPMDILIISSIKLQIKYLLLLSFHLLKNYKI